jgi:hypothetical protein
MVGYSNMDFSWLHRCSLVDIDTGIVDVDMGIVAMIDAAMHTEEDCN